MSDVLHDKLVQDECLSGDEASRIDAVVVFSDQAYLKRCAQVRAKQGLNRFLMEVQAHAVDIDSAQAGVYGDGEILSVQYKETPVKEAVQEYARELDAKKEQLVRKRKGLEDEMEVRDKQIRFLDSVVGFGETEIPKEVKTQFPETESLKNMLQFLADNYQRLAKENAELLHRIEELGKELYVVEKKLKKQRRPKEAKRKGIEVMFESGRDQEVDIEVYYVARNASWEPVYRVDVPLDLSDVRLTMFARIQQRTGENWNNVKLAVSNAVPLKSAELPDMQSWYLTLPAKGFLFAGGAAAQGPDAGRPGKKAKRRAEDAVEVAAAAEAELLSDLAEEPVTAKFRQAEQKELPLAFEYELPQSVTMDSDGGETMLPLYSKEMNGEFFIHAVPRNDPLPYLVCRSSPDRALLAGRLNIHFGGRFVGGTALAEKKAGEDLLINLGAERGLKVHREKVTDKVSETFFGVVDRASAARELEYRTVVENLKDEPTRVRLLDSIPVSKTDRVQIKGVETKPAPTTKDYQKRQGVMLWDIQVKPKSVQEIRMKFHIKHPKDVMPEGL